MFHLEPIIFFYHIIISEYEKYSYGKNDKDQILFFSPQEYDMYINVQAKTHTVYLIRLNQH